MSSDFALDKLSRLKEAVAEADHTPELRLLLAFADCSRQAEEQLRAVGALRAEGAPPTRLVQQPGTFQARGWHVYLTLISPWTGMPYCMKG